MFSVNNTVAAVPENPDKYLILERFVIRNESIFKELK